MMPTVLGARKPPMPPPTSRLSFRLPDPGIVGSLNTRSCCNGGYQDFLLGQDALHAAAQQPQGVTLVRPLRQQAMAGQGSSPWSQGGPVVEDWDAMEQYLQACLLQYVGSGRAKQSIQERAACMRWH
jgi:hypothetical protein